MIERAVRPAARVQLLRPDGGFRPRVIVALVVLIAGATAGCSADPTPPSGQVQVTPSGQVKVTPDLPPPPGAVGPPTIGITTLPKVAVAAPVDLGKGLVVSVTRIDDIDRIDAVGPGQIAGPGVSVLVSARNTSAAPIDVSGVTVTADYGADVPAIPVASAPTAVFTGLLKPNTAGAATYAFYVPAGGAGSVRVKIEWVGSPDVALVVR